MPNFNMLANNWNIYRYPWRPNERYISLISKYITYKSRVCILGATIEYRDLCKNIGCNRVDIYDLSKDMLYKDGKPTKNERFIEDNWFSICGKYDIILGDLVCFLLLEKDFLNLIAILKNRLNEKGKIIIRHAQISNGSYSNTILYSNKKNSAIDFINTLSFYEKIRNDIFEKDFKKMILKYSPKLGSIYDKIKYEKFLPYSKEKTINRYKINFGTSFYKEYIFDIEELGILIH